MITPKTKQRLRSFRSAERRLYWRPGVRRRGAAACERAGWQNTAVIFCRLMEAGSRTAKPARSYSAVPCRRRRIRRLYAMRRTGGLELRWRRGKSFWRTEWQSHAKQRDQRHELVQVDDMGCDHVSGTEIPDDGGWDYLAMVEPRVKAMGRIAFTVRSRFSGGASEGIDKAQSLELSSFSHQAFAWADDCLWDYNDLTMIPVCRLGVAMENAVLPVRKAVDFITYSNNDDGVAHVVEKFML